MVLLSRAGTGLSPASVETWRLPRRLRLAEHAAQRRVLKPRRPSGPHEPPRLLARLLFSMTAQDESDLRRLLLNQSRREYGAAIAAEARRLGYNVGSVRVTDPRLLKELNERAKFAAHSIRTTYNRDLEREIARIRREAPRANRHVYASRLGRWDKRRADWKNRQIGITEMGQAVNKARGDFYERNGIEAIARVVPRTAVCMVCAGYVGMGDMSVAEARSLELPVHVHCMPGGTRVLTDDGWKAIASITPGRVVAGASGWTRVEEQIQRRYAGQLMHVRSGSLGVYATPEHPFATDLGWALAGRLTVDAVVLAHALAIQGLKAGMNSLLDACVSLGATSSRARPVASDIDAVPAPSQKKTCLRSLCREITTNAFEQPDDALLAADPDSVQVAPVREVTRSPVDCRSMACQQVNNGRNAFNKDEVAVHNLNGCLIDHIAGVPPVWPAVHADGALSVNDARQPCSLGSVRVVEMPFKKSTRHALVSSEVYIPVVVDDIKSISFDGMVYNLRTADGTFVAEGLLVHNCDHEVEYDYSAVTSPLELPGALPGLDVLWTGGEIVEV